MGRVRPIIFTTLGTKIRQIVLKVGIVSLLASCSASQIPNSQPITQSERVPWFCQTGEDSGEWDCIQSESLAENPNPTRSPPQRVAGEENERPQFTARAGLPPTPSEAAGNEPPTRSAESQSTPISVQDTNDATRERAASDDLEENLPKYIRLAYRPEKAISLMDLPTDFFAVQVIALSSKENLEAFAREQQVKGMSAAEVVSGDEIMYVLLLGIYESRDIAEEAAFGLPPPFDSPWIRSIGSLQQAMLAAEQLKE